MSRSALYLLLTALALVPALSHAAKPHITECPVTLEGGILTIKGKVAGLGNQTKAGTSLTVTATGTAACVDGAAVPTPLIVASVPVSATETFPPKNGNRDFSLDLEGNFVPPCEAPLEVVFVDVEVCDTTHDVCCSP